MRIILIFHFIKFSKHRLICVICMYIEVYGTSITEPSLSHTLSLCGCLPLYSPSRQNKGSRARGRQTPFLFHAPFSRNIRVLSVRLVYYFSDSQTISYHITENNTPTNPPRNLAFFFLILSFFLFFR